MKILKPLVTALSLILIGTVSFFYPFKDEQEELEPEVIMMEEIDIVELPMVSAPLEKLSVVEAELEMGSNLNDLLLEHGLSRDEASSVVYEISPYLDLRYIQAGEIFKLNYVNDVFTGLTMVKSKSAIIEVVRDNKAENGFRAFEKERQLQTYVKRVTGQIENSLYDAAIEAGLNANTLHELIGLLMYDVDFQRDIQEGDTFNVAFEAIYDEDGNMVDEGEILYAQLITDGRDISIFYYTDLKGESDHFNPEGKTIRKTLLKTPINGAYITSGFGRRISPITGFNRMHQGIDFGAPAGTPIYASGDGVVESAYYSRIFGNFIEIRHVNEYRTLYAHMTRYAPGIRKGIRVKQGQTIGYVGSTGMSTGPHLHYEISLRWSKVNPSTVKAPPGRSLSGDDLILFENLKQSYIASFM